MEFNSFKKPVSRILSFISRYMWIARDGLKGKSALVTAITILSMSAAAIGGVALSLSAKIINTLQGGEGIHLPYTQIYLQEGGLIIAAALCITSLLAIASYATFYSRLKTRELARAYHSLLVARMLDIAEQRNIYVQPEPDQGQISLRVMINRNTMHISRGLERIVMTMQPLSYALAAIVTASYLSPRLSLISCFLFLFLVIPMYRKSSELNENARMYFQKTSANMGKTLRKYINQLEASSLPAGSELKSIGYQYMEEIPVAEHLDRFDNIRLGPARMVLVTSIFMAVTVGIGMLAVGYMLHVERQGWGTALAFMGALILLLRSLQNLGRSLAVLNRYYPQIVDYMEYFRTLEKIVPSNPDELPGTLELQVYKKQIPDSLHNLQLQQGQAVNLVCDRNINRSNLTYIGGAILRACSLGKRYRMEFAAKTPQPSLLSIREHLNRLGSDNQSQIDMAEELKYFGVFDEIDRLPDGFETRLEEDICSSLSVRLSALLYLLPLSNTAGKMVFIDGDLFSEFDETEINHLLKMFHKFYIFVVSNYSRRILLLLSGAVVLSEGNVIGAGTAEWLIDKEIKFDLRASEQAVISEDDMDDLE